MGNSGCAEVTGALYNKCQVHSQVLSVYSSTHSSEKPWEVGTKINTILQLGKLRFLQSDLHSISGTTTFAIRHSAGTVCCL
jgi:hypothetical protein